MNQYAVSYVVRYGEGGKKERHDVVYVAGTQVADSIERGREELKAAFGVDDSFIRIEDAWPVTVGI